MNRYALGLILSLTMAVSACNTKPQTIVGGQNDDDMKEQLAKAKPVTLPPSISASKSFRCKDNSVAFVDFYSDGKSAGLRLDKSGPLTKVEGVESGKEMSGPGGFAVDGSKDDESVSITSPGHPKQTCSSQ